MLDAGVMTTRRHLSHRLLALGLATLVALVGLGSIDWGGSPAAAATTGAGYPGITPYGGYLGNYIAPDGTRVYCIDSGREWPSGTTDAGTIVGSFPTSSGTWLDETTIRKLNYALLTWGQTADPTNAAAVSAYVYAYTSNFAHTHGTGYGAGLHYINGNAAVKAAYDVVWNESETRFAGAGSPSAGVTVELTGRDGLVTVVVSPAQARGTLRLDGAVVAGTSSRQTTVTNGSVVPISAIAADSATTVTVAAEASFSIDLGAGPSVVLYSSGSQQRTIRGAFPARTDVAARDEATATLRFSPIVQTRVAARFVDPGQAFVDGVTASVAPGSAGWRTRADGTYVPVTAVGTLYGPFSAAPPVAAEAPASAPVVGTESIVLTGPGDYSSSGSLRARVPGFYTWVWRIDAAAQPADTVASLPAGYSFVDEFGLVAESHVVPMALAATTRVSTSEVAFGGEIGDELSVAVIEGSWLTEGAGPVAASFVGTAYFVPGETAPQESDTVPAEATVVGTASVVATGPGIYAASTTVRAPAAVGYVTWVWSLDPASPMASYFQPWSDRFGVPAETTRVVPPTVSSLAQEGAAVGDDVYDVALVGGLVPEGGASLVFEAFLQPTTEQEPRCDADTRVFDSSDTPVRVEAPGSYRSPATQFQNYGTYYWIESLYAPDGTLVARGACGLPEETTLVAPGEVVTHAVSAITPGGEAYDSARVSGRVPVGATLVFEAFDQRGVTDGPLCDASTRVFTSDAVPLDGPGTYVSESATFTRPGTFYWVETLYDRLGNPLHVGTCGLATESTLVRTPSLPNTGFDVWPLVILGGALSLGGAALLVGVCVRAGIRPRRTR
jgi:hypothetical protein